MQQAFCSLCIIHMVPVQLSARTQTSCYLHIHTHTQANSRFFFQLILACLQETRKRCRGETLLLEHLTGEWKLQLQMYSQSLKTLLSTSKRTRHSSSMNSTPPHFVFIQDGTWGGDVWDFQGPSIWLQSWYVVSRGHIDWTGTGWATQSRDEPYESFAENS